MSNGRIIYQGPSLLDGAPIVVIAIGFAAGSANSKTGNMIQTHILRADMPPTLAIKTGADASICGACPHRGDGTGKGRTCYVNVGQGPLVVWKSYMAGKYPLWDGTGVNGRMVRLGTYGDPAAVPVHVWDALLRDAGGHTGYTHQWETRPDLARYCMASADSTNDALRAQARGWRTFRVALPAIAVAVPTAVPTAVPAAAPTAPRMQGEVVCPASAEAGRKLTCVECRACNGTASGRRGSIVIQAHGGTAVMANVRKLAV